MACGASGSATAGALARPIPSISQPVLTTRTTACSGRSRLRKGIDVRATERSRDARLPVRAWRLVLWPGAARYRLVAPAATSPDAKAPQPAPDDRQPQRTDRYLGKDGQHQEQTRDRQGEGRNGPVEVVEGREPARAEVERRDGAFADGDS